MKYRASQIAEITNGQLMGKPDIVVTAISTDSRSILDGECFWAIRGENFDGNDYTADVLGTAANCAVVSRKPDSIGEDTAVVLVDDTIAALGLLASHYRNCLQARIIGITGSVGKTTTRNILYDILSQRFRTHRAKNSFNNNIGLPLTILQAPEDTEILITEMGSNHPGEIEYLTQTASPDIALITTVTEAHLEGFGSVEAIAAEKASIAKGLTPEGILITNGSVPALQRASAGIARRNLTFGFSRDNDYHAANPVPGIDSGTITIGSREINIPLAGMGNLENALAAWAVCSILGMGVDEFAALIQNARPEKMRMDVIDTQSIKIISDCYNANPASMKNAINYLKLLRDEAARLVFIAGHMGELGSKSAQLHAELGREAAKAGVDVLLTVGTFADITAQAALENSGKDMLAGAFTDTGKLAEKLPVYIRRGDAVLVKGSRSMKLETIVNLLEEIELPTGIQYQGYEI